MDATSQAESLGVHSARLNGVVRAKINPTFINVVDWGVSMLRVRAARLDRLKQEERTPARSRCPLSVPRRSLVPLVQIALALILKL